VRERGRGRGREGEEEEEGRRGGGQCGPDGDDDDVNRERGTTYREEGRLDDLAQLVDLLLAAADVLVRHVGLVLDLHHGDGRVDLGRQRDHDLVVGAVDAVSEERGSV